jgi:integrase
MVNDLSESGLSYSTVKKAYESVSACMRYYRIKTSTSFNPCEGITLPELKRREASDIRFFSKEERKLIVDEATRKFSNGAPAYRLGWAYVLLLYSGLRVGELCALTWDDIDFTEKTITVHKNAVEYTERDENGKTRSVYKTQNSTKTRSGMRIVPMTEKAFDALIELYKITGRFEHITTSINGKRIMPTRLSRTFYKILDAAGLRRAGCHTLRHTFATMLFSNGCEVKIVSELLGHSNTKITENIYIHLIQQQKVKAIASIDKYSD